MRQILARYSVVALPLAEAAVMAAALDQGAIDHALTPYIVDEAHRGHCAVECLAFRLNPIAPAAPAAIAPAALQPGGVVGVPVTVQPVTLALAPQTAAAPAAIAPVVVAPAVHSHWWVWIILAALLVIGVLSAFALGYSRSAATSADAALKATNGIVPALKPDLDAIYAQAKASKDAAQLGAKEIVEARADINKIGADVKAIAADVKDVQSTVNCISSRMATSAQIEEQSRRFLYGLRRVERAQKQQGRAVFNYFPPSR
jgi:hypothetical protein